MLLTEVEGSSLRLRLAPMIVRSWGESDSMAARGVIVAVFTALVERVFAIGFVDLAFTASSEVPLVISVTVSFWPVDVFVALVDLVLVLVFTTASTLSTFLDSALGAFSTSLTTSLSIALTLDLVFDLAVSFLSSTALLVLLVGLDFVSFLFDFSEFYHLILCLIGN